ncbi:MAG: energy transducer TonB [Cytophagales bacterium]|nr:energy transducer TonB [Cytophagales bacterium]
MIKNLFLFIAIIFCANDHAYPVGVLAWKDTTVYTKVEHPPDFPGGMKKMYKFIKNNIQYPAKALENKVKGNVFVAFIIEKNGSLSNIQILQGIGYGCDEEVRRVIKLMPLWIPGKENEEPKRVKMTLPLEFPFVDKYANE